ncbi:hypothetical protein D3C72_1482680 [compost metagenome]
MPEAHRLGFPVLAEQGFEVAEGDAEHEVDRLTRRRLFPGDLLPANHCNAVALLDEDHETLVMQVQVALDRFQGFAQGRFFAHHLRQWPQVGKLPPFGHAQGEIFYARIACGVFQQVPHRVDADLAVGAIDAGGVEVHRLQLGSRVKLAGAGHIGIVGQASAKN